MSRELGKGDESGPRFGFGWRGGQRNRRKSARLSISRETAVVVFECPCRMVTYRTVYRRGHTQGQERFVSRAYGTICPKGPRVVTYRRQSW